MKNLQTFKKLQKEIKKNKSKLQKLLDKGIIYENFGNDEIRRLKFDFGTYDIEYNSTDERNMAFDLINQFADWCAEAV